MLTKYFTILANLFYKCYKCLRMLVNAVANLTNVLRMKRKCKTLLTCLHKTHSVYFSLSYICKALTNKLIFLQIWNNIKNSSSFLWECQY